MRVRTTIAAAAAAVLLSACGGATSNHTHSANSTPYGPKNSPYAVSKCMRANGLTHFPDPVQGSGGVGFPEGLTISVEGELTVDGVTFSGPALKHAEAACKEYLPGGNGPPPTPTAQQKYRMVEMAQCMRTHGVPSFPDPGSAGPVGATKVTLPGQNTPAFKHALQVCGVGHGLRVK